MNKSIMAIGLFICVVSGLVGFIFKNPYPCTISGIGCDSSWEMMRDTWSDYFAVIGMIIGVSVVFSGCNHEKKG